MSVRVDLQGISADYFIDRESDDWPACIIGIPSSRVFFPDAKGFRLNSAYGLPNQGFSADFAPRGIYFRVFGSNEFPNTFGGTRFTDANTEKSSQYKRGN
jgi:hypothetical protein